MPDDHSAHPDLFSIEKAQEEAHQRLFRVLSKQLEGIALESTIH
jgi:hypothetical protein